MRFNKQSLFFLFILCITLSACKTTDVYKNALEAFSQGAELETRQNFAATTEAPPKESIALDKFYSPTTPGDENRTPLSYYEEAAQITDNLSSVKSALEKAKAYDNALTIAALAAWKTGDYDKARDLAAQAERLLINNQTDENDIRDLAIVRALPGLINMDMAFDALGESQNLLERVAGSMSASEEKKMVLYNHFKTIYQNSASSDEDLANSVNRGLAILQRASDKIEGNDDMELYLLSAQLAGLDTWGDLLKTMNRASRRLSVPVMEPEEGGWINEEQEEQEERVEDYLKMLETKLGGDTDHPYYLFWKDILKGA